MKQKLLTTIILLLTLQGFLHAQNISELPASVVFKKTQNPLITRMDINYTSNSYYIVYYRDTKPDDVPQEIFDALFEIQLEVVNNFTYDNAVLSGKKKYQYMYTKEDYYKYGKGVCDNYANFFIILAQEKGLTENLYKASNSSHAWLEYHTENNVYIIDPTWSDDYAFTAGKARELFKESPAYGKLAFFITYTESKIIFGSKKNHSLYKKGKTATALWNRDESTDNE